MPFKLRSPGGERTWITLTLLGFSVYWLATARGRIDLFPSMLCGVMVICSIGLWFNQQWARWVALSANVLLAGYWVYLIFNRGFNSARLICTTGSLLFAWWVWKNFSPTQIAATTASSDVDDTEEEKKKPMISLVLLLRELRYLEAPVLAQILSSAWGGEYSSGDSDDDEETQRFVVGKSPLFAVQSPEAFFVVHNFDRQYFDDTPAAAADAKELRLRKALEDHQAWLAVDLIRVHDEKAAPESVYPQIAKLIAELAGDDCVAILQPETNKINVWDASLEEKLRGPNPLEDFTELIHIPVIEVADDDPRMMAAVAKARTRWPEFVAAFKKRDGEMFSVKAPVTVADKTEFIWIKVDGLEPEYIHGKLANDPVALGDMKLGDRVEIPVKDLNDWAFFRKDRPVGLFTVEVIRQVQSGGN